MARILLDRDGDALRVKGYICVETEVDFLDKVLSDQALLIIGSRLCDWAEKFYKGRVIDFCDAPSPIRNILELFPSLNKKQAEFIYQKLGRSFFTSGNTLSHQTILGTTYPIGLWFDRPTKKHAAEWLLWLDKEEPDAAFSSMLREVANAWMHDCPEMRVAYDAANVEEARNILIQWLGIQNTLLSDKIGEFPCDIPEKWKDLASSTWRKEMIKTKGQHLGKIVNAHMPRILRHLAALEALSYFERNPHNFSREYHDQISRFVFGKDRERLRVIAPAAEPSNVPDTPEAVLQWFFAEYAPYREWQSTAQVEQAYPRVLDLGRQFAKWYLDYYPVALNSKKHISFFKSQSIQSDSNHVTLLIVLDGLHLFDAQTIIQTLLNSKGAHSLGMLENGLCFAPIPTVTDFAKGALVRGAQPSLIKQLAVLGEDVSERETPLERLQSARKGELFIWRIQEPDHTYHLRNKYETLKTDIQGQLNTIAQKIIDIVENVASSIPLQVILTTDHGRFLGSSTRSVHTPNGMEAHGRAAWGKTDIRFDAKGYIVDDENMLVYLSKDRFGLSDDAAVILSDTAFKTNDGKQNSELYTHGGLFPEEVIIPWIVFVRDVPRPDIEIAINGEGRSNQPGLLTVLVINSSRINLTVVGIEFNFGIDKVSKQCLTHYVESYRSEKIEINITSWPSSEQVLNGRARLVVRLPDGDEVEFFPSLEGIKVTEIYTRDKSFLEGLDL